MRTDQHGRIRLGILFYAAVMTVPALGCASQPKPRPTALDPSNPAAPESPPLAVTALGSSSPNLSSATPEAASSRDAKPPSGAEHGHSHEGSPPAADKDENMTSEGGKKGKQPVTIYTCPMHPEVISDKPGRCPKCGMTLVPKEPAEGKK